MPRFHIVRDRVSSIYLVAVVYSNFERRSFLFFSVLFFFCYCCFFARKECLLFFGDNFFYGGDGLGCIPLRASVSLLLIFDRVLRNSIRRERTNGRRASQKLLLLLLLLLKKVVYLVFVVSLVEKFKNESVVLLSIHPDISFDNNRGIIEGAGKEEIYIIAV